MLPIVDSPVIKDITYVYCVVSLSLNLLILLILYWTEYYLLAGHREHLNVLLLFVILEIFKWLYHKMQLEKDIRITYKKRALSFFSLFTKSFDVTHLLKAIIVSAAGAVVYHVMAILFGAEVFDKYEQTFIFALQMSILTVLPMYLNFGSPSLVQLLSGLKPTNSLHLVLYRSFQATVFGAWSGALVIPLDWGRPWQVWPVPCSFGALFASTSIYMVMYCHLYLVPNHISLLFKRK